MYNTKCTGIHEFLASYCGIYEAIVIYLLQPTVTANITVLEGGLSDDSIALISLPSSLIALVETEDVNVIFTYYDTPTLFPLPREARSNLTVGSAVIGAIVANHSFVNLSEPVVILLRLLEFVSA